MQHKNSSAGLMITLGHNSSALFYDGLGKPIGYEEERLTGKKSDSSFPRNAIDLIISNLEPEHLEGGTIFISHWFDTFKDSEFPDKYYDRTFIDNLAMKYNMEVELLHRGFTHHDAHAYSAKAFLFDSLVQDSELGYDHTFTGDMHVIVADGFGNNQEVISIYKLGRDNFLERVDRIYGFKKSLGLMYQFATSYCGMKENQDEYKFLGYESSIAEVVNGDCIYEIDLASQSFAEIFIESMHDIDANILARSSEPLNTEDLGSSRDYFKAIFDDVLKLAELDCIKRNHNFSFEFTTRCVIGYFIQGCVEKIMEMIVDEYEIKNVTLAGGCFYNVKLNNAIMKKIEGKICVIPLAGDQGAAIGMYEYFATSDFKFYDLCYGNRSIPNPGIVSPRILFYEHESDFVEKAVELLDQDCIVNIVTGGMEFGPRALCNTSTLARPSQENVDYINRLNDRNTVMPMAPVVLNRNLKALFNNEEQLSKVVGSNRFMIVTHDISDEVVKSGRYEGITHAYPDRVKYSGRPQVVHPDERPISKILEKVKSLCLINTSFNTHGTPILYDVFDCIDDFTKQRIKDKDERTYLLFLANSDD